MELPQGKMLLSQRETAKTLGVSDRTVYAVTFPRGTLVPTRIGSRVMYSPANIQRWIEENSAINGDGASHV